MLQAHFHAFGWNAPKSGIFIEILQFAPPACPQFGRAKKCQGDQFQRELGLSLARVAF